MGRNQGVNPKRGRSERVDIIKRDRGKEDAPQRLTSNVLLHSILTHHQSPENFVYLEDMSQAAKKTGEDQKAGKGVKGEGVSIRTAETTTHG
jgi:hypothetical protein